MLISHEVPISLLEESKSFNDYDYCLLHLTKISKYRNFYKKAVQEGRKVLLDNSLFELGDALTIKDVREGVLNIHPTWVVVPDRLDNAEVTIQRFREWEDSCSDLNVLTIGVAQGNTLRDLVMCYLFMAKHADKIAIPFDSYAFNELVHGKTPLETWCEGRQLFIEYLKKNNLWSSKPHHLLGCSLAKEFSNPLYNELNIETIDTSNPVVAAIKGFKYTEEGLSIKPSIKLCDLIDENLSEEQQVLLKYNVDIFKRICGKNQWVAFFSQTGSEICTLAKKLGRWPDKIITNRENFNGVTPEIQDRSIIIIPNKPALTDYLKALKGTDLQSAVITLHGYLRILPKELCAYQVYNLHPGLITDYPELKGFNPQEKAYKLHLPVSGVVIHRVIPEVDSGEILIEKSLSIENKSLEEIHVELHDLAIEAWVEVLKALL